MAGRMAAWRRTFLAAAALAAGLPVPAAGDGLEPAFVEFESLKLRFEREEAERRADGVVLQRLRGREGEVKGRLSLGGASGRAEDPFENTAAAINFRGSREEELGGFLKLRISF